MPRLGALGLLALLTGCPRATPPEPAAEAQTPVQDPFDGDWGGTLELPTARVRLVLHVRGIAATLDSLDQGVQGIPASSVSRDGDRLRVSFSRIGAAFEGTREGITLDGTWTQAARSLPLTLTRDLVPQEARRPQDPETPLPYPTEDLTLSVGPHTLACTLAQPSGAGGPWPGVVLVTGSGPQDRDEALAGHRPFLVLADHLARQGVASLRCDDRGVGESTGDHEAATTADFAEDARAAAEALRARDEIASVGFIGHSEGGLIAPLAADASDFQVLLAPPALPGDRILITQVGDIAAASEGLEGARLEALVQAHTNIIEHVVAGDELDADLRRELRFSLTAVGVPQGTADAHLTRVFGPWFRYFLTHDPAPSLRELDQPTLALWGGTDVQVQAVANAAATRAANARIETRIFPGLNHLFQPSESGSIDEYAAIETTLHPDVLQAISDWIGSLDGA